MKKPALIFITILISLSAFAGAYCNALSHNSISNLENCNNTATESNSYGAYAYGSSGKNVYITKLLPDAASYSVTLDGTVKSLCMDNNYLCAVYTVNGSLCLMRLDADSGAYKTYTLGKFSVFSQSIFAVSDSRVYFLVPGKVFTYVSAYSFDGEHIKDYTFSQNAVSLFTNSGKSYVRMYDGSVYRLDTSGSSYCLTLTGDYKIYNAGNGWIADTNSGLYSLVDGRTVDFMRSRADYLCVDSGMIYYSSGQWAYCRTFSSENIIFYNNGSNIKYISAYKGKAALISGNCTDFTVVTKSEFESISLDLPQEETKSTVLQSDSDVVISSDTQSDYFTSEDEKIIYNIESGTTVSQFKKSFSQNVTVTNSSGTEITSGKLKTGYSVLTDGERYTVAVTGDLTGEGNVNSRDISLLMEYIVKSSELSGAYKKAADYNIDGSIDNKDLILIARNRE